MSRSIDPFEEYLRKKKVELLERQYREKQEPPPGEEGEPSGEVEEPVPSNDDPEREARVREEMDEFFASGQTAGAQLFREATGLEEEQVEEIKDALEEVFEEETAAPHADPAGETFVEFFQQVQSEFDEPKPPRLSPALPVEQDDTTYLPVPAVDAGPEAVPAGGGGADPVAGHAPATPVAPAATDPAETDLPATTSERLPASLAPVPDVADLEATALEVSSEPSPPSESGSGIDTDRINLVDVLLARDGGAPLEKQVEVLCRLVARLAERASLSEAELIEALIKSDVEF